ncbi:hypothetical protein Tco_0538070 [Tanacetum coccineum]
MMAVGMDGKTTKWCQLLLGNMLKGEHVMLVMVDGLHNRRFFKEHESLQVIQPDAYTINFVHLVPEYGHEAIANRSNGVKLSRDVSCNGARMIDLSTVLIPNDGSLEEAFAVEWAEQEHFEDEETKLSCPKINLSNVLKSNKGSSDKSFQSLSYLHEMQKRKQKIEESKAVQHQDIKKHINPENVRLIVLAKLQEALDEEDILADQILTMMHRYADRFTNRRVEINNLMVLQDHPLVDYGKYALGCMTGADMKKCVYLKSVRDELLRSMEEKRQLMANYRDM